MKSIYKNSDPNDPFADLIQIRKIGSTNSNANKVWFNRETVKKNNPNAVKSHERYYIGSNPDIMTGLKYSNMTKKNQASNLEKVEKIPIPRQMKRAPLKSTVKMISINIPRFGRGQAIIPSLDKESVVKKLPTIQNIPINAHKLKPENLLEDVQKEIDISQNQLEKLHSILRKNNVSDNNFPKPKWKNDEQKLTKLKRQSSSKDRVISTLTTLNKKLNDMQEKYFGRTKTFYKSINDIPLTIKLQSDSDIELNDSNSDVSIKTEEKNKILEKFHLSKINKFQNDVTDDYKRVDSTVLEGRYETEGIGHHETYSLRDGEWMNVKLLTNSSTGGDSEIQLGNCESNSMASIPNDVRNHVRPFEFVITLKNPKELLKENNSKINYRRNLCDKGQNFSTNIPDVLLPNEKREKSVIFHSTQDLNENDYFIDANVCFEEERIQQSELSTQNLLQSRKNMAISDEMKNYIKPDFSEESTLNNEELVEPSRQSNPAQSKSISKFYDCTSKLQTICDSPTTSKKKIFYDRFNSLDKTNHQKNVEVNSAPNLPCKESSITDKSVFEESKLMKSIAKSDFLSKKFTIDASGNFAEQIRTQVTKNRSDQFFSNGLDWRSLKNESGKTAKNTRDMYNVLTKALSNTFYELPPQNQK